MKKRIIAIILGVFFMLAFALPVYASLEITEIMYDPAGTDTNREWIEIHNPDPQPIDLSEWAFWQGGTNHKIHTEASGTPPVIAAQNYAILAHSQADFLSDYPQFAGTILDSSFSLKNTGELIELKNGDEVVDQTTFDPKAGAGGDGNSLQKNPSGIFAAALPTPGAAFTGNLAPPTNATASPSSVSSALTSSSSSAAVSIPVAASVSPTDPSAIDLSAFPTTPQIFCKINTTANWTSGVEGIIDASSWGLLKQPLQNADYLWNFGDGSSASTMGSAKVAHTYVEAGQYVLSLSVGSGQYSASDRVIVTVTKPDISIIPVDQSEGAIVLQNNSTTELNLSGFYIHSAGNSFVFPQGSFILAHQKLVLGAGVLKMPISPQDVTLVYPNGVVLAAYDPSGVSIISDDPPSQPSVVPATKTSTVKSVKSTKAAKTTKVLSAKVTAKAIPDQPESLADATETEPITLSIDDDGPEGAGSDGPSIKNIIIFSGAGLALLAAVGYFVVQRGKILK